jgi:hypothetical protein
MPSNAKVISEAGYEECPDGIWRQKSSAPQNKTSGANPKPNKGRSLAKNAQVPRPPVCKTIAIVTIRTVRPRDYDGLGASTKYYLDSLRHCGLFEDDSPDHLEVVCCSEHVGSFQEEETLIELYQIPL